jgi:ribonuclease III
MLKIGVQRQKQLLKLMDRLGLSETAPVRWELLDLALMHSSLSTAENYEQLEFLGDAVLRLFVAQQMWTHDRTSTVGQWTAIRSVLVSDRILSEIAYTFGLERFLLVAPSAQRDNKGETSRLADALEAVIGALYLSTQNFSLIEPWLRPELEKAADNVRLDPTYQNYKAALQQLTQAQYRVLPTYQVEETPQPTAASLRFRATVLVQGECLGSGTGASRKEAEKSAAEMAYLRLQSASVIEDQRER